MLLLWKLKVLDRENRSFLWKWLVLDTETLNATRKHQIELAISQKYREERDILRFREWFTALNGSVEELLKQRNGGWRTISVHDYAEDLAGNSVSPNEALRVVTGNPDLISFPSGYRTHDIMFAMSDNSPMPEDPLTAIGMSQDEVNGLALFLRDVQELKASPFFETQPVMHSCGNSLRLETISVDYIRSFVQVFRRLYMTQREPGNFLRACEIYCNRFWNRRITDWVEAESREYAGFLAEPASYFQGTLPKFSFSNKRLVDVFLYTAFAHQPDDRRSRQRKACEQEIGCPVRTEYTFYTLLFNLTLRYVNVERLIKFEMDGYWKAGGLKPDINTTAFLNECGRGQQLTKAEQIEADLAERIESLARELCRESNSDCSDYRDFIPQATSLLTTEE